MQIFLGTGLAAGGCRGGADGLSGPALLRPPALAGTGRIGETLRVDPGVWRGATSFVFTWLRDGAPIVGAEGPAYAPAAADDRAAIACRVTAVGPGPTPARAHAETPAITIAFPPPLATVPVLDFQYTSFTGFEIVDISPFFSGSSLRFSVKGDGVSIDPATAAIAVDLAALAAGGAVLVTAANSGGLAEIDLRLRVATLPALIAAPAVAGSGRVGAPLAVDPGVWSGQPAPEIALQWLCDGSPIEGAAAAEFVPGPAEDARRVTCRVTATNLAGTAAAETAPVAVAQLPPAAIGVVDDRALAIGGAPLLVPTAAAFAGAALVFTVEGGGAEIDPATGVLTLSTDVPRASAPVKVTATNSGGSATIGFAVTVLAAPAAVGAPASLFFDQKPGTRTVAAAGFFAGDALVFALEAAPAGVTIDAATGVVTIPVAAALAGEMLVAASNSVGAATARVAVTVRRALAAPIALGAPAPAVFLQGTGTRTISAQAFFAGDALVFALDAAPKGVTINAGSGLVSVPTETALAGDVVVRAANARGAATQRFALTVAATATVFDTAAALGDVRFVFQTTAPSWTRNAGGFARLRPAAGDRAHGDWHLARGDGRYRVLARWTAGATAPTRSRPFGLIGRLVKTGADFRGVRAEVVLATGDVRTLQLSDYTGSGVGATQLGTVPVAWAWNAWWWLEAEFDGPTVRARLYPEAGAVPDWQLTVTTATRAPGTFGPTSHAVVSGQIPIADIRRLEYQPLALAPPALLAAPAGGEWTLNQITVQE